eukprot:scaffold908_cov333-Prasinococcus_capsulatus_cf.AAC.14
MGALRVPSARAAPCSSGLSARPSPLLRLPGSYARYLVPHRLNPKRKLPLAAKSTSAPIQSYIADKTQKVAVVTGANCGIGLEVARGLYRKGFCVVLACRNREGALEAQADITNSPATADGDCLGSILVLNSTLHLDDLYSVHTYCEELVSTLSVGREDPPVHLLVNNAGIMASPFGRTKQAIEQHFELASPSAYRERSYWHALASSNAFE